MRWLTDLMWLILDVLYDIVCGVCTARGLILLLGFFLAMMLMHYAFESISKTLSQIPQL